MIILIADIVSYIIRKISLFFFLYFRLKINQQNEKFTNSQKLATSSLYNTLIRTSNYWRVSLQMRELKVSVEGVETQLFYLKVSPFKNGDSAETKTSYIPVKPLSSRCFVI